jgi:hypothetical protein
MKAALAIALLVASPVLAQAPDNCGPRIKVIYKLANQFLESPIAEGLVAGPNLAVLEWWGNPKAQTWTLLRTTPDGKTCIIMAGTGFAPFAWRPTDAPV